MFNNLPSRKTLFSKNDKSVGHTMAKIVRSWPVSTKA